MRRLLALALLLLPLPAWAQGSASLQAQLRQMFDDQRVTLRTFYSGERLRFDSLGLPLEAGPVGPWTTDAEIRVQDVSLTPDAIVLRGRRQHFVFGLSGNLRHHNAGPVTVEVQWPERGRTRDAALRLLARVFLRREEKLSDFVPSYWKFVLTRQWESVEFALNDFLPGETLYTPGRGDVSWPKVIGRGDSLDAPIAVCGRIEGEVGLVGVVGPEGSLRALQIVSPFGLGLDDRAAEIIGQWRFQPAKKGRDPVSAQVRFQIFFRRSAC
jgi:hypothetical protein